MTRLTHPNQVMRLISIIGRFKFSERFYMMNGQTFTNISLTKSASPFLCFYGDKSDLFPVAPAIGSLPAHIIGRVFTRFIFRFIETAAFRGTESPLITPRIQLPRLSGELRFAKLANFNNWRNPSWVSISHIITFLPRCTGRLCIRFKFLRSIELRKTTPRTESFPLHITRRNHHYMAAIKAGFRLSAVNHSLIIANTKRLINGIGSSGYIISFIPATQFNQSSAERGEVKG
jgi:hypothetical protein